MYSWWQCSGRLFFLCIWHARIMYDMSGRHPWKLLGLLCLSVCFHENVCQIVGQHEVRVTHFNADQAVERCRLGGVCSTK